MYIQWYIPIKEYYSHGTKLMNLEDITLSEISQSQIDKHCMIPLTSREI